MIVRTVGGRRYVKSARSRRRGAVAVELTLTLCFIVIPMLLGIWEIGCLLDAQQTLVEAVREGGRQAATGTNHPYETFIKITADGSVTAYNGHVDLGTGIRTALGQIVAEIGRAHV